MSNQTSVTDLLRNFALACRALVPLLDRANVPWADGKQYDNWDRIAEALFLSLVLEPCRFQAEASFPKLDLILPRYGFVPNGEGSFLSLNAGANGNCRFGQLVSSVRPFDTCEGWIENERVLQPLELADVSFVIVEPDSIRHEIRGVDLNL